MTESAAARSRMLRAKVRKLIRLAGQPEFWPAVRIGVAASVEHLDVPFDSSTQTVLDVGASHGQFSLLASKLFPEARIICFEPLADSRKSIEKVLGERVEVIPAAVGSSSGEADLNISARDDSSSLLPIGERQLREFPGTGRNGQVTVSVTTLDESLQADLVRPCLLKIDVQGSELQVLKGAARVLSDVDEAFIECSFVELYGGQPLADEVIAYMSATGFRLAGVHGIAYSVDGSAIQADFLFRRRF